MSGHSQQIARLTGPLGIDAEEIAGEADVEVCLALEELDLLIAQLQTQGLDVVHEMLDLAAADDGEDVGGLLHDISEGDGGERGDAVLSRDLFERGRHLLLLGRLRVTHEVAQALAGLLALLDLLLGLELAAANHVPRRQRHAKVPRHRDDVALKVARHHVPPPLVHAELRLALFARVRVGRRHDPRGRVADPQVEHFALHDEDVECVHDFFDRGRVVLNGVRR